MRKIGLMLLVGLLGAGICLSTTHPVLAQSDFQRLALRVSEIRQAGSEVDGLQVLSARVQISEDDYFLMGCDNSSARRNHPEVGMSNKQEPKLTMGRWFAGGSDLNPQHVLNGSLTGEGKNLRVDVFYATLPRPEYQASSQEVAWHYLRVKELRAQNIPVEQRIATMKQEAKSKPWEQMQ